MAKRSSEDYPNSDEPPFSIEALALLSIAKRAGLSTAPRDWHCPAVARSDSPYIFDRNAWMRVDFQPQRRWTLAHAEQ